MVNFKFNKSDYKLIWIFAAFMFGWLSLKFWTENHPFRQIAFDIPIIIAKTLAGFFIVRWLIQKYLVEKKQYFLFLILSTASLIATGFIDLLRDYFGRGLGWDDLPHTGYIIVHSFYYSASDLALPFVIIVSKKYFENQAQLAKTREKQKEAELKLLRSQLNPHFLFNNLNTIDALVDTKPDLVKNYVRKLSSLYRYLIATKDTEIILLEEELKMAKDYFYLIKIRYGGAYQFKINIEEHNKKACLLTGSLLTLMENVIKHNQVINGKPILTALTVHKDRLILANTKSTISNTSSESFGTGLKNIEDRYHILLNRNIKIENTNSEFMVTLPLTEIINPS